MVVIVSREDMNRGDYVTVVPVTSRRFEVRSRLPNCVPFRRGEFCFVEDCVAQAENVALIEKLDLDLDRGPVGALDDGAM